MQKFNTLLLLSLLLISGCITKNHNQLTIALDYSPNINYIGIYMAIHQGYYQQDNTNINLINAASISTEQLVITNQANLGVSYSENLLFSDTKLPLTSIYSLYTQNLSGFISRSDKNITSIKDFANKTYCGWGSEAEKKIITALAKENGVDPNSINIVNTDHNFINDNGSCDIFWSYEYWSNKQAKFNGIDYNYIPLSSLNLNYYTPIIISKENDTNPLYSLFIKDTIKGFNDAINDPQLAINVMHQYDQQIPDQVIIDSLEAIKNYINPTGYQDPIIWEQLYNWAITNNLNPQSLEGVFTNEYITN